eukprot:m.262614 g.262614  ORF g.262614 m.262614 type:complete len:282 (-) comp16222_c1_seq36:245-1090(-)
MLRSLLKATRLSCRGVSNMAASKLKPVLAQIKSIEQVSESVKVYKLSVDDTNFKFSSGQWLDVHLPVNGPQGPIIGGYSICNSLEDARTRHNDSNSVTPIIAVKESNHPAAIWMHKTCVEGSCVHINPGGDTTGDLIQDNDNVLFIGGGIGISPLHGMLQHTLEKSDQNGKVGLLYSIPKMEEFLFKNSLDAFSQHPRCEIMTCYITQKEITIPTMKTSTMQLLPGRITQDAIEKALSTLRSDHQKVRVFLCGPPSMIDDIERMLLSMPQPPDHIHFERWW